MEWLQNSDQTYQEYASQFCETMGCVRYEGVPPACFLRTCSTVNCPTLVCIILFG